MNKVKVLSILVVLLLVLNLIILGFLFIKENSICPRSNHPPRPHNDVPSQFEFDSTQEKQFELSKESHRKLAKQLQDKLKIASDNYYHSLPTDSVRQQLYTEVEETTNKIYQNNIDHFDDIREICRPDQLPALDQFIKVLLGQSRHDRER